MKSDPTPPLRIAIMGPPNAGKSALVNALIGRHVADVSPTESTTEITAYRGETFILVDTPGIGSRDPGSARLHDKLLASTAPEDHVDGVVYLTSYPDLPDVEFLRKVGTGLGSDRIIAVVSRIDELGGRPEEAARSASVEGARLVAALQQTNCAAAVLALSEQPESAAELQRTMATTFRTPAPIRTSTPAIREDAPSARTVRLQLDVGEVIELSTAVVLGRDPDPRAARRPEARPVPLRDPSGKTSRTHAELRLVPGGVEVIDCGSTNGVFLRSAGEQAMQRIPAWEPTAWPADAALLIGGRTLTWSEASEDARAER